MSALDKADYRLLRAYQARHDAENCALRGRSGGAAVFWRAYRRHLRMAERYLIQHCRQLSESTPDEH